MGNSQIYCIPKNIFSKNIFESSSSFWKSIHGAVFEKFIVTQDKNKFGLTIVGHQKYNNIILYWDFNLKDF